MDDVIGQVAWNKLALHSGRQCTATSKQSGERCKRAPIVGGFVCSIHGGSIPAVKKSARERLLAMVDPALDALLRALHTGPPCAHCGRSDADRDPVVLRAAQVVLDRAGYHPTLAIQQATAPNPYENYTPAELADRAEAIAIECRRVANEEAVRLLPDATDAVPLDDAFLVPEDEEPGVSDAALQNDEQRIPFGNDTPDESTGVEDEQK